MTPTSSFDPTSPAPQAGRTPQQYAVDRTWHWNLTNAPQPSSIRLPVPPFPGSWDWCGLKTNSPLGVAAGPLLCGNWLLHYARLGFDILVYKTVRTSPRECYPLPNLVPVNTPELRAADTVVACAESMNQSWAVSFGMPSLPSDDWQADIRATVDQLQTGQILVVSVVGTQSQSGSSPLELLADDYAACAQLACDAGAHGIEANFSCPNVTTDDGQLYQNAEAAGIVAKRIRSAIGTTPLVLKIGFTSGRQQIDSLLNTVTPYVQGLAMTNAISARVRRADGTLLFDGAPRGICGSAIRDASQQQVRQFSDRIRELSLPIQLVGVGGIFTLDDVNDYLRSGASSVALATAPMARPTVAIDIRESLTARRIGSD